MQYYPLHRYFIDNGAVKPNTGFKSTDQAGAVYEVIRIIKGIPLFPADHLDRFFQSSLIAGRKISFSRGEINEFIYELIEKNDVHIGNILLSCSDRLRIFYIPHKYPDEQLYLKGIECGVLQGERDNPNVKVFQTHVRQLADEMISNKGVYEVLLVDHLGRITEGSRSNVFFVKSDIIYTPPGYEVLKGVTRNKAIHLANENNIHVIEHDVLLSDLALFDAVFITSTSSKILPVSKVEELTFNPNNNIVQLLKRVYDELIEQQI
jgi:branched-chain amino acid aminotransferase